MHRCHRTILREFVCFVFVATLLRLPALAQTLVGVGTLDHVRVLVRDIDKSRALYVNTLGFVPVHDKDAFVYPEGSAHDGVRLADNHFVEWIGIANRENLLKARPWIVNFIERYEGAHSVGMAIASAADLAARLRARGIDVPVSEIVRKPGEPPVVLVTPRMPHIPTGAVFFVQYPEPKPPAPSAPHPNTAFALRAAWVVVRDLAGAAADMKALGFKTVRTVKSQRLNAEGEEFAADHGSIVVLRPTGPGPAQEFVRTRGEGVMGATILAGDVDAARSLVQKNTDRKLPSYDGWYGKSFLIPSEIASGAWIEIAQGPAARADAE